MIYIFCEDRTKPIQSKVLDEQLFRQSEDFKGCAQPGEFYCFQICLYSKDEDIKDIKLECDTDTITCFNLEGIDDQGKYFEKTVNVNKGKHQVLWLGIDIPQNQQSKFENVVSVKGNDETLRKIKVEIDIKGECIKNQGQEDLWRLARLKWLNSTVALNHDITKPYEPIKLDIKNNELKCLGRKIFIGDNGLPTKIQSFYDDTIEICNEKQVEILQSPITMNIKKDGKNIVFNKDPETVSFNIVEQDRVSWNVLNKSSEIDLNVKGTLEYDGFMRFEMELIALEDVELKDLDLEIPFTKDCAEYATGLGLKGGYLSEIKDWKWNNDKRQDCIWIGNVNGGLQCRLKGEHYEAPYGNVYYNQKPLEVPECWNNNGDGGLKLFKESDKVSFIAYNGNRKLQKGECITYVIEMLITPVKPINYKEHFTTRYYHYHIENQKSGWIDSAIANKCNYVNVHHGQEINPFINYPFIEKDALKELVREGNSKGVNVKVYYTLRELTNHIAELWPFYSLNGEIFPKPLEDKTFWKERDDSFIRKHIGDDVIPAWQHVFYDGKYKGQMCASILTRPESRLNNYYLEGLNYLVQNVGIKGIYVDDTSYDRTVIRRARRILDKKEGCLIDLHSWNHMNEWAGWASNVNIYMTLFPYLDSLWTGEGFNYDESPDYWLIQICGIPYGLMGEMLNGDGNPYRGMIYGMTNRAGWGVRNPKPIFELWDDFGIQDAKMFGYWSKNCPIKTNNKNIYATAYVKEDKTLISLASWNDETVDINLSIDWDALNLNKDNVKIYAPEIDGLQKEKEFSTKVNNTFTIEPKKGLILEIN